MKGYGLSVFRGQAIERFDVEVLGVVRNSGPGKSVIIARISGQDLEVSGVIAGMSGSPVYIDGKVVGAVSSGWGFSKVPIAGITPIEDMLRIETETAGSAVTKPAQGGSGARRLSETLSVLSSSSTLSADELVARLRAEIPSGNALTGEERTKGLTSPVLSGFSQCTLETFAGLLPFDRNLAFSASAGTTMPASNAELQNSTTIEPGSSIAALLISGDLNLGATGTVSYVYPDGRFLAFGHPFLGYGDLDLPVAPSLVVSVLPNLFQSFKIASPGKAQYRLRRDRDTGISGGPGTGSPMVPFTVRFSPEGGTPREIKVEITSHPKLLPALAGLVVDASLTNLDSSPRDRTSAFEIRIESAAGTFRYADQTAGTRAREIVALTSSVLTSAVVDNEFQDAGIKSINVDVQSQPGESRWRLTDAAVGVRKVRPGDRVSVFFRTTGRRDVARTHAVILEIPREAPEGRAAIVVADGNSASMLRLGTALEPRSLADFRRLLALLSPSNEVTVALAIPTRGAATGSHVLSSMPPTAAALLSASRNPGESGVADVETRLLVEVGKTLPVPVSGNIRIDIEIEASKN